MGMVVLQVRANPPDEAQLRIVRNSVRRCDISWPSWRGTEHWGRSIGTDPISARHRHSALDAAGD